MRRIVQNERDLGKADRSAFDRAAENDILHFCTAQAAGGLLAEHPADCVGNIGLAAAVRADDRCQTAEKLYFGFIRKGLEALKLQAFENHAAPLIK